MARAKPVISRPKLGTALAAIGIRESGKPIFHHLAYHPRHRAIVGLRRSLEPIVERKWQVRGYNFFIGHWHFTYPVCGESALLYITVSIFCKL
jgi:hypothetical protein